MKSWRKAVVLFTVIAIVGVSLTMYGCGSSSDADSEESQIVKASIGTLMTTISSFGSISMPEQAMLTFGSGGSINDVYTVSEVNVGFGDGVEEGQVLARLDTTSLQRTIEQKEADLRTAQINLEQASSEANLAHAKATVSSAKATLASAEEALKQAKNSSISDAETNLENAQRSLATAQRNGEINIADAEYAVDEAWDTYFDFLWDNVGLLEVPDVAAQKDMLYWEYEKALEQLEVAKEAAATSVANAEANVTAAENALANAPIVIQQKEATVATAKAALAAAEDSLADVEAGHDVQLAQIQVDNAKIAVDEALDQLEAATIAAPFNGVVARVNAGVGDEVRPNDVIIHLVNMTVVEVDAAVDEIDVAGVEVGQMATVSVDALPKARLKGQVSAVSPIAASQSGVVTYDIAVEVQNADQYELREGMSATITIMALDVQDVLLVPSNAVQRTADGNAVQVVIGDGQTEERVVEIGATNGIQTEIVSGLADGERVVVQGGDQTAEMIQESEGKDEGKGGGKGEGKGKLKRLLK
jgi:HlyD family secretion protein